MAISKKQSKTRKQSVRRPPTRSTAKQTNKSASTSGTAAPKQTAAKQSGTSKQESVLGMLRQPKGATIASIMTLTAEGRAYLSAARRILADLDEAEQAIADQGSPRGRIRVSAAVSHGRLCIVPLLGEFVRRYPNIVVDINLGDGLVDIAAGQADVAVRGGPLADSALTARRLSENGRTIVASPGYLARWGVPETPEDLYNHNCLNFSFRRAEPVWPFRRDGVDFALKVRGAIEANSGETLGQLALDGVGIARVGNFSLEDAIAEGRLVPLLEPFNPGDKEIFHAVFVGGANMPARVRVFVDYLVECMGGSRGRHQSVTAMT